MTKIVGLTGGIGSGKSTIANYFKILGIQIYIADLEAKKISNRASILKKIKNIFGDAIFDGNVLNRKKLGEIVFNDANKLKQLNSIVHPEVKKHFKEWLKSNSNAIFVIKESAILIETGDYLNCDFVVSVVATQENQISRVMKRDSLTRDEVLLRIINQISNEERNVKSNYVITNNDSDTAKLQVNNLYKLLKSRFE